MHFNVYKKYTFFFYDHNLYNFFKINISKNFFEKLGNNLIITSNNRSIHSIIKNN